MVRSFFLVLIIIEMIYGQTASDYYNKPIHEVLAKVYQESTYVHSKGYISCSNGIYTWADKNRVKYKFLSVTPSDSTGVIRLTSIFNCRNITGDTSKLVDTSVCNLVITSCSNSLRVGCADYVSCIGCGALQRSYIQKEIVHLLETLPDSVVPVAEVPHISKGIGDSIYLNAFDVALEKVRSDSLHVIDSIRVSDSLSKVVVVTTDVPVLDSVRAQYAVDSISAVLGKDSVEERKQAFTMFIGQLDLSKPVSVDTKLECIEFMVCHNLRKSTQVIGYIASLSKLCKTRQDMYYAARLVVSPEHKYLCVKYYKKARDESGRVELCKARLK